MAVHDLAQCRAAVAGRAFIEAGYFWEAHEVLEAVWLACPPNSAEQVCVRGVIQLANARLKEQMGHPRAAARLMVMARELLADARRRGGANLLGFDVDGILSDLGTLV